MPKYHYYTDPVTKELKKRMIEPEEKKETPPLPKVESKGYMRKAIEALANTASRTDRAVAQALGEKVKK